MTAPLWVEPFAENEEISTDRCTVHVAHEDQYCTHPSIALSHFTTGKYEFHWLPDACCIHLKKYVWCHHHSHYPNHCNDLWQPFTATTTYEQECCWWTLRHIFAVKLSLISPLLLSWSFTRVINFKFPLWPHQKYCITAHRIRIWLFIAYSNERWLCYYSLPHLYIYFKVGRVYCLNLGVKSVNIINLWFLRPLCNQNMSLQSTLSEAD